VSDRPDVRAAVAAMKLGALDVLVKPADPGELAHAIKDALCRDDEAAAEREVQELARAKWASLSSREQSVCRLVAQGLLNKQVAAELGVNIPTAHSYRVSAFKKLRVDSASALYRFLYLIKEAV
jgi:FixJ family two-component response regulator